MVVFVSPRRMMEVMGHVRGAGGTRRRHGEEFGGAVNGGGGPTSPYEVEADEWRGEEGWEERGMG